MKVKNPSYAVGQLTVNTFLGDDGDWGFAVYDPCGSPIAIGSGVPSEKAAARAGKAEALMHIEISGARGCTPNPYLGDAVERAKSRKYGYPTPPKTTRKKTSINARNLIARALK